MRFFERKCAVCKGPIEGRRDRRTCGDRCRTALTRAESSRQSVTSGAAAVTSQAVGVTAAAGTVTGATWSADEPSDELGHWTAEEDRIWP